MLEGQLFYHDSWDRTANGSAYRDSTGQLVSPGRDVARLLGVPSKGAVHGIVAGGMDGVFDILADPVQRVAGIYGEAKSPLGNKLFAGLSATKPGDAISLYERPGWDRSGQLFRTAVDEIANTDSAARIVDRFGNKITDIPGLANELARADTPDRVLQVFENHLSAENALDGHYTWTQGLPMTSRLGQTGQGLMDAFENRFPKLRSLEKVPLGGTLDTAGDGGVSNLRQQLLMGLSPAETNRYIDQYLATDLEAERVGIAKTATKMAVINRAGVTPAELDAGIGQKIDATIDHMFGGEQQMGPGALRRERGG